MSKKKSAKKSNSLSEKNNLMSSRNGEMETADLSNLIDAVKSSLMDFHNTEKVTTLGAELAPIFDSEEWEDVKKSVELFEAKSAKNDIGKIESEVEEEYDNKNETNFVDTLKQSENDVDLKVDFKLKNLNFVDEVDNNTFDKVKSDSDVILNEADEEVPVAAAETAVLNANTFVASSTDEDTKNKIEAMSEAGVESEFETETETKSESDTESESEQDLEFASALGLESDQDSSFGSESDFASNASEVAEDLIAGSELEGFESAAIEELEFVEEARLESIIESVLFATDRPVSIPTLKQIFKGTNVTNARIKKTLETLQVEYAGGRRGVTLEEVGSGFQLRTKVDNMEFLRRSFKAKSFKLSGPALEVLAITAYKQPVVKAEIDEIRGVESGHLLRALMEKNLVLFAGKSDLPGKPMQYATTRKFLEIFGLRNLKELPTLSQIDELLPDGIGDEEEKPKLADITDGLSEKVGESYSEGEEELLKISDQLEKIDTSSEFFEKEKLRQKQEREAEKARNIQEAIAVGEEVSTRDRNWLKRYEEQMAMGQAHIQEQAEAVIQSVASNAMSTNEFLDSDNLDNINNSGNLIESFDYESSFDDESDQEALDLAERFESNDIANIDEEIT